MNKYIVNIAITSFKRLDSKVKFDSSMTLINSGSKKDDVMNITKY